LAPRPGTLRARRCWIVLRASRELYDAFYGRRDPHVQRFEELPGYRGSAGEVNHGFCSPGLASTSFQNSAADLPLICSSVVMERKIAASRSARKSQDRIFRGIPRNTDRSVTFVLLQSRTSNGMSCRGARSVTGV